MLSPRPPSGPASNLLVSSGDPEWGDQGSLLPHPHAHFLKKNTIFEHISYTPYRLGTQCTLFDCSKGAECALYAQSVKGINFKRPILASQLYGMGVGGESPTPTQKDPPLGMGGMLGHCGHYFNVKPGGV